MKPPKLFPVFNLLLPVHYKKNVKTHYRTAHYRKEKKNDNFITLKNVLNYTHTFICETLNNLRLEIKKKKKIKNGTSLLKTIKTIRLTRTWYVSDPKVFRNIVY